MFSHFCTKPRPIKDVRGRLLSLRLQCLFEYSHYSIFLLGFFQRTESECLEGGGASASVDLEGHPSPSSANTSSATAGDETPDGKDGKKKKNRCQSCKKKVGLTGKLGVTHTSRCHLAKKLGLLG